MKAFVLVSAVVFAVLLVPAVTCLAEQLLPMPHPDHAEGCCGLSQCSALVIGPLNLALGAAAARFRAELTSIARSVVRQPVYPPPEPVALGSA